MRVTEIVEVATIWCRLVDYQESDSRASLQPPVSPPKWNDTLYRDLWGAAILSPSQTSPPPSFWNLATPPGLIYKYLLLIFTCSWSSNLSTDSYRLLELINSFCYSRVVFLTIVFLYALIKFVWYKWFHLQKQKQNYINNLLASSWPLQSQTLVAPP